MVCVRINEDNAELGTTGQAKFRKSLTSRLTIAFIDKPVGRANIQAMRFFVFIALVISMAVSPAVAAASCVSMDANEMMSDGPMSMGCEKNAKESERHDAGCAAACALMCPGFYAVHDMAYAKTFAIGVSQYVIPLVDPGVAPPSLLEPPPPRS